MLPIKYVLKDKIKSPRNTKFVHTIDPKSPHMVTHKTASLTLQQEVTSSSDSYSTDNLTARSNATSVKVMGEESHYNHCFHVVREKLHRLTNRKKIMDQSF